MSSRKLDVELATSSETKITLTQSGKSKTVDLYSPEGQELISTLWLKQAAEYKYMYELSWLGIPIIQLPHDIVLLQELIYKVKPDYIVECGVAHGGSAIFYASILELIGHGKVIAVDVEIRKYNRIAIEAHPLSSRITLIEGSSVDGQVFEKVKALCKNGKKVLVTLDSNHSFEHVAKEMELYQQLVTPGSYLVAMDGAQALVWDMPRGKVEHKDDNPLRAIHQFLKMHSDFAIDPSYTRLFVTSNPDGFLRKLTAEEIAPS